MRLTVFTPTYNRRSKLIILYHSLLKQNPEEFIWLIVDDGSTDDTKDLVQLWILEGRIAIEYYYQHNGGKMRAHNKAVKICKTELFICVDSDDHLVNGIISQLIKLWDAHKADSKRIGIIGKHGISEREAIGKGIFPNVLYVHFEDLFNYYEGDTEICFRTDILKQHLFPEIQGEKFITEDYIYLEMNNEYFILFDNIIAVGIYEADGYTKHMNRITYENPVGCMYYNSQRLKYIKNLKDQIISCSKYVMYSLIAKKKTSHKFTLLQRILMSLLLPFSYVAYYKRKKQYLSDLQKN